MTETGFEDVTLQIIHRSNKGLYILEQRSSDYRRMNT